MDYKYINIVGNSWIPARFWDYTLHVTEPLNYEGYVRELTEEELQELETTGRMTINNVSINFGLDKIK